MIGIHTHDGHDNFVENLASGLLFAAIVALFSPLSCTNLLRQDSWKPSEIRDDGWIHAGLSETLSEITGIKSDDVMETPENSNPAPAVSAYPVGSYGYNVL